MTDPARPILYHHPLHPGCWRVRRLIGELRVDVVYRDVLLSRRHRRDVAELAGRVAIPCLVLPQTVIADTAAILRFLRLRYGRGA